MAEWISVKDKLPFGEGCVLVCLNEHGAKMRHGRIDTDQIGIHSNWVRWRGYITHWMPLPEPPKEEE